MKYTCIHAHTHIYTCVYATLCYFHSKQSTGHVNIKNLLISRTYGVFFVVGRLFIYKNIYRYVLAKHRNLKEKGLP